MIVKTTEENVDALNRYLTEEKRKKCSEEKPTLNRLVPNLPGVTSLLGREAEEQNGLFLSGRKNPHRGRGGKGGKEDEISKETYPLMLHVHLTRREFNQRQKG